MRLRFAAPAVALICGWVVAARAGAQEPSGAAPIPGAAGQAGQTRRGRTPRPSEFGLRQRFRLSVGSYDVDEDEEHSIGVIDNAREGSGAGAVKLDYVFFRPTRHEAMLSLHTWGKTDSFGDRIDVTAMLEYRFRFGGFGKGYYGIALGTGISNWAEGNLLSGSALGVDLSPSLFVEFRSVSNTVGDGSTRGLFMVGTRF